ncbi:MAG: hypothetical protein SU899_06080 [Chloroflexota bacterium]|nr:hypothetical protein [Chloroflexota bacterium]
MRRVAVVTGSIFTITRQMVQEYGIEVMSLYVVVDGKDYSETEVDGGKPMTEKGEKTVNLLLSSLDSIRNNSFLLTSKIPLLL